MSKPLWMQRQEEFKKFKSIPISDAEFNQAIKQLKFDLNFNSEDDYKFNEYLDIRWREFCLDAIRELRNILVSGKCKFGKGLFIGKFNYALFDRIITGNYHCKKKVKECEHRVWVDCEEKYSLYSYQFIEECGFPLFECDGWWKREIFPPLDSQENRPMFARFTKLKFIVNSRTNSIHCKYEIQVQTVGVGAKFLTV